MGLNKRFKQQQQIIWQGKGGVLDRTIYEDGVFARMLRDSGHMDERDYKTYSELRTAEEMAQVIKKEYAKIANIRTVTFGSIIAGGLIVSPSSSPEKKKLKTAD